MGPVFFGPLSDKLSQGDLVTGIPWGLIDDPITVCRPVDASKAEGKATYATATATKSPAAFKKSPESIFAAAHSGLGMVLWHDCQIDKFESQQKPPAKWFAAVAPLLPVPQHDQKAATAIRDGLRRAFFFVPAYPEIGVAVDCYVDLRHVWSVKQSILSARVGTLSQPARDGLYRHLFGFLTQRTLLDEFECPGCGHLTPMEQAFPGAVGDAE